VKFYIEIAKRLKDKKKRKGTRIKKSEKAQGEKAKRHKDKKRKGTRDSGQRLTAHCPMA